MKSRWLQGDFCDDPRYTTGMTTTVKITKVRSSAGIVLPKEVLAMLRARLGDTLYVSETPDCVHLTAANPDNAAKMDLAEQIMREDRDILHKLVT